MLPAFKPVRLKGTKRPLLQPTLLLNLIVRWRCRMTVEDQQVVQANGAVVPRPTCAVSRSVSANWNACSVTGRPRSDPERSVGTLMLNLLITTTHLV